MKRTFTFLIRNVLIFSLLLIISAAGMAQKITVTGTITEEATGLTIVGATVLEKGTTNGTVSDVNGKYTLSVPKGATIVFSYIGFMTQEIVAEKEGTLDVRMSEEVVNLGELIVIGYSTQKKSDKTGAVTLVKSDELNRGDITSPIQALQGKAAGVLVSKKGGDPSENFTVRIRGASGFSASVDPLYVIDGVPGADPSILSPDDIDSYNILKDAASTAIYGSRGANGVIIITTKTGRTPAITSDMSPNAGTFSNIDFTSQISFDKVAKKYDILNASEIRSYANMLLQQALPEHPNYTIDSIFVDGGANTDWQDEIFRVGVSTINNLSLSGGNKHTSYLGSVGYNYWEGAMKGTSKQQTTARIGIHHSAFKDRLNIMANLIGAVENNDYENYDGWDKDDIIYQALSRNPTDPVYNPDGSYYKTTRVFNYENPISVINEVTNTRDAKAFQGSMKADLEIIKGLVGSVNLGYIRNDNSFNYFRPADLYATADNGFGKKQYDNYTEKLMEITGTYVKSIKDAHNMNFLLGYSWQQDQQNGFYAQGSNANSNYAGPWNLMVLSDVKWGDINSWKSESTLIGFFGRAQYNYKSKYFISASLRRDGSSKFGANHKWGWFPTVAIGWSMEKEKFMKSIKWLDQLKIRASYGESGNQEIGEYHSIVVWQPSNKTINPETGQEVITFAPAWNANPNLKWESTSEVNLGLDFAVLNQRLSGTIEIYYKETADLLGDYNVPVPPNLASRTFANSGSLSNKGIEVFLQAYAVTVKNFTWKTMLNVSSNKTEILDLGDYFSEGEVRKEGYISGRGMVGEEYYVTGIMVGQPIGSFYLPHYVTLKDGKFVYESVTGGYTTQLSEAKRSIVGCAAPKVEIGWSNTLTFFKNWDLDFSLRAWIGNDMYNATKMFFDAPGNLPSLNAYPEAISWEEQGRTAGASLADIYVEDASFLKLDYIALTYNFNVSHLNWIKKFSLYLAANNVFTITGYSGVDPETRTEGLAFGIDQYNVYPKTRSFTFGLKAGF